MFKDLPEGQTHSENDGCGEKEHNKDMPPENLPKWEEDFYEVLPIVCSPLTADSKVARIKKIFEKLLVAEYERGKKEGVEEMWKMYHRESSDVFAGERQKRELDIFQNYWVKELAQARSTALKEAKEAIGKIKTIIAPYSNNHELVDTCDVYKALHALKEKK